MASWREPVEVGRGDVNPYGIPVPNPHEQEGPDEERTSRCAYCGGSGRVPLNVADEDYCSACNGTGEQWVCPTCGEEPAPMGQRCPRCERSIEQDRLNREIGQ